MLLPFEIRFIMFIWFYMILLAHLLSCFFYQMYHSFHIYAFVTSVTSKLYIYIFSHLLDILNVNMIWTKRWLFLWKYWCKHTLRLYSCHFESTVELVINVVRSKWLTWHLNSDLLNYTQNSFSVVGENLLFKIFSNAKDVSNWWSSFFE